MNTDGVEKSSAEIVNPRPECTCSSGGPCFKHPYAPNGSYTSAPLRGTGYEWDAVSPGIPRRPIGAPYDAGERKAAPPHLGGPWPDAVSPGIPRRPIGAQRSPHQDVMLALPSDAGERKAAPICSGVLDYFPAALVEVARLSKAGNDQHNPGQPLHWARGKSSDHADCIVRHLMQRGTRDTDGILHSAKVAWRALALLQEELEAEAGFTPSKEG